MKVFRVIAWLMHVGALVLVLLMMQRARADRPVTDHGGGGGVVLVADGFSTSKEGR